MKLNVKSLFGTTHEGAPAPPLSAEQRLRRSVAACLLWEDQFYEGGVSIAERIADLVPAVEAEKVAALAVEARERMKLRHAPLLLAREMARRPEHKKLVAALLERVIQRADEPAEFLALYWKEGRQPLSAQVKKGLARALTKFDAYQLAKYDREGRVRLRDVLFLSHAKPKDSEQAALWRRLVEGELPPPDTWEAALSAGQDKKAAWERLLKENRLGGMALLRNLRNMLQAGVEEALVFGALERMSAERILPFRFIAAARYAPQWEEQIEKAMLKALSAAERLPGRTVVLVDVSGSMDAPLSRLSMMRRVDAACGLAILAREVCERVRVFAFSERIVEIPARRGFALRDAIVNSTAHGGTYLGRAVAYINDRCAFDRLIVVTDEQSHDKVGDPKGRGYMINTASYRNGVGYGKWIHIDGWSEAALAYILESEKAYC